MIRKLVAVMAALLIAFGAAFADEIKGQFVKFADGKLTLKVGEKEQEFKIPEDLKMKRKNKDGKEEEVSVVDSLKRQNDSKFGKRTVVLTVDKEVVKEVKYEFGKAKDKTKDNKDKQ